MENIGQIVWRCLEIKAPWVLPFNSTAVSCQHLFCKGNVALHKVIKKQTALKQLLGVSTLKALEETNEEKAAHVTLKRTPFSCSFEALGSEP